MAINRCEFEERLENNTKLYSFFLELDEHFIEIVSQSISDWIIENKEDYITKVVKRKFTNFDHYCEVLERNFSTYIYSQMLQKMNSYVEDRRELFSDPRWEEIRLFFINQSIEYAKDLKNILNKNFKSRCR